MLIRISLFYLHWSFSFAFFKAIYVDFKFFRVRPLLDVLATIKQFNPLSASVALI